MVLTDTPAEPAEPAALAFADRVRPAPSNRAVARPGQRAWWTVAGLTLLMWSFQLFGYVDIYPIISLASVVLGLWGLGTVAAVWQPWVAPPRLSRTLAVSTLLLAVGAFLVWSYLQVLLAPSYGTDEIAFDQYAAQLLQHGTNPYTHSMASAFSLFHVSPDGYTFRLDGQPVTSLSYPALSFLLYLPFLLLGWSTQMAVMVNVVAWALGIVLAFAMLPRSIRPLAIVVGSFAVYISYAVGGVTDALFVPLLLGAVYRWDRFTTTSGPRAWRGPIMLGLAMAVKQTPWLVFPFLVGGIAIEAHRRGGRSLAGRCAGRYVALVAAAFFVPNLPFIVWSAHAWLSGVLTPIASHTVPAGQGLVGLTLFLGVGGGSLAFYTLTLVFVFVLLLLVYLATYPAFKAWAVVVPALVLFFSARSFGSYLVTLLPAAMVAAFSIDLHPSHPADVRGPDHDPERDQATDARDLREPDHGAPGHAVAHRWRRRWPIAAAAAAAAGAASLAITLTSTSPLDVRITSVRTTGQLATVVQVGVEVANRTGRSVHPAFTVESGGDITAFWLARQGPPTLAPHGRAHYTLLAPNFFAQPPITGGFQVVAFTSSPATVSRSTSYLPTSLHLSLEPDAVPEVIPLGQPVVLRAEVLDKLNRPVHVSGEPVYLGQIIYDQQGLLFGQAIINQAQIGQTPVVAYTDDQGVATFVVRGTRTTVDPVYFEANLVSPDQFYPYGYSEIVPIRFGSAP